MTVTEAPRDVVEAATAPSPSPPAQPAGLAALVGSGDPRNVGKLFVGSSLLFLLVAAVTGVLVGFERTDLSGFDVLSSSNALQITTLHAVTGLFLVVLPLLIGLATAVVPLQVGAATVAFPRVSVAAYWTYLVSAGLVIAAYALDGGPYGGDFDAVSLFIAGFIALIGALLAATVSVVTTVLTLRAPGMSLRRTPLFSWSMLVAGVVWLLVLPVLAAVMLLAYLDLRYGEQFLGGTTGLYDRIAWVFWQPTLYAFAIPALGIIGSIVPVFARRRHHKHATAMALIGLFGAVGFGAWAQLGFAADGSAAAEWSNELPWYAASVGAPIAVLGLLGLWTLTLGKGAPRLRSPLVASLLAGLLIALGVAGGVATIIGDLDLVDTTWMTAQANLVLVGTVIAALAGLTFWAPKLYGKLLPEPFVVAGALLLAVGAVVLAGADAISGLLDQPRFVTFLAAGGTALDDQSTIETLNLVAAIGGAVALLGAVVTLAAVLRPRRRDATLLDDPWDGHTLEWATTSPPPVGNFAEIPPITSEAPVYDARYATTEASA
jgi:heme/copper-type cytochrome/quinol oxidase subunit 1